MTDPTLCRAPAAPCSSRKCAAWLLALATLLGLVVRGAQYAADRSYWHDEASLVLNIRGKTVARLFGRLDYNQAAPPMFLVAERGIFCALGGSELSLRLFPLLCGLASVVLFALLAHRLLPAPWDALATALFALSDTLIFHAVEVKPYGIDVFFTVLMLLLAVGARPGRPAARRLAFAALAATAAVFLSYTAVLVFAAISLALLPGVARCGGRGALVYAVCNLPVVLAFAAVLLISVKAQQNASLNDYWREAFLDWSRPWAWPWWFLRQMHSMCNYVNPGAGPVLLAALAGGVWALRARPAHLMMLAGPILIALLAAAAHRYPFDGARLTAFLTPCVLLLAAFGLRWIVQIAGPQLAMISLAPTAYVLILAAFWSGLHLLHPRNRGHLRPIAQYLHSHAQPGDGIYCLEQLEFECYWPANDPRVRWEMDPANQIPFNRFWIVWSFPNPVAEHRRDPLLKWAAEFATQKERITNNGGAAVLFQRVDGKLPLHPRPPPTGTHHKMMINSGDARDTTKVSKSCATLSYCESLRHSEIPHTPYPKPRATGRPLRAILMLLPIPHILGGGMAKSLAFIGLGIMGLPMAGHLLAAGHPLRVHTRTKSKAADLLSRGARWADSPADAAREADVVFICVPDTPDVQAVVLGADGIQASARAAMIVVDHSTISPAATREMAAALAGRGASFLDAPVSGGDVGAKNATLSIMVGGDQPAFAQVQPFLQLMGKTLTYCGPSGAGQLTKLVNQVLVSVTNLAVCEALAFAKANGLDLQKTLAAVGGGAAGSWQLNNLGPKMAAGDFAPGFTIKLQQKDLRLALEAAKERGLDLSALKLVHQLFC